MGSCSRSNHTKTNKNVDETIIEKARPVNQGPIHSGVAEMVARGRGDDKDKGRVIYSNN